MCVQPKKAFCAKEKEYELGQLRVSRSRLSASSCYLVKNKYLKKHLNRVLRFEAGRSSAGENASWGARATGQLPKSPRPRQKPDGTEKNSGRRRRAREKC